MITEEKGSREYNMMNKKRDNLREEEECVPLLVPVLVFMCVLVCVQGRTGADRRNPSVF